MLKAIVLVMMIATQVSAQSIERAPQPEASTPSFSMGPHDVVMPEKYFLLIRKGGTIGAIRFTKIELDLASPILGKSSYESYFQSDGSGSFLNSNVVKRSGEIEIKQMRGIHAFAWQPGQDKLRVGKWWFGCGTPRSVNMSAHFLEKDEGFEFAPTSAQRVDEIDASDKRLKWFRYNPGLGVTLPVSELPK